MSKADNEFIFDTENQIMVYVYRGDQTFDSTRQFDVETKAVVAKLKAEHRPVLMLIDVTEVGQQDSGARRAALELLKNSPMDKMAVVGGMTLIKYVTQLVLLASGLSQKVRYFSSKAEAVHWLKA